MRWLVCLFKGHAWGPSYHRKATYFNGLPPGQEEVVIYNEHHCLRCKTVQGSLE